MEEPKPDNKYDPRSEYEWVPAVLVITMMVFKCFAFISPYVAALFLNQNELGLIMAISSDETFNMILVTLVGFWIGKKVGEIKP